MAKGKNTVALVWEMAEPLAKELGLSIWDVRFLKEGADWYLRIFIDKQGGVSIDDCVDMTHAINKPLDESDPIEQAYFLEVSSPGVERDLVRDEHFTAYVGEKIKVKMIRPVEGKREFSGILEDYNDGNITIRMSDESGFTFTKKEASWIKADDFEM
ncbi:MAG: ribosome maturation factor RimP [Ruminococcaceae bacterium]|nr:ribosome maturation factor RimP [Oscillospiraceae bacterium]MBQ9914366.1 ribosome maturation factor RimP [Clostridia bacterium]